MKSKNEDLAFSITIPTVHFIKKFLAKKAPVEPFKLTNKNCHISALVLEPIAKDFYPHKDTLPPVYDDYINFQMNTSIIKEGRFHLDKKIVLRINRVLRDRFDDELYHFVTMLRDFYKERGELMTITDCIDIFKGYYDLSEDDISTDTLVKTYYRDRCPGESVKRPSKEQLQTQLHLWKFD